MMSYGAAGLPSEPGQLNAVTFIGTKWPAVEVVGHI
jgi:hypothetical protein